MGVNFKVNPMLLEEFLGEFGAIQTKIDGLFELETFPGNGIFFESGGVGRPIVHMLFYHFSRVIWVVVLVNFRLLAA
jgi:hypothetical protein